MKILIQDLKTQKASNNIKVLEIVSTEINTSNELYIISNNETPLIKFTDTEETFLIKELNSKLLQNNSETLLNITDSDLVSLSSAGGGGYEPPYKVYTGYIYFSKGQNAGFFDTNEDTIGAGLELVTVNDSRATITFPEGMTTSNFNNVWVSPLIFKGTDTSLVSIGVSEPNITIIPVNGVSTDTATLGFPKTYFIQLPASYISNSNLQFCYAEIEIRVYN
jgi:hypothetical protein